MASVSPVRVVSMIRALERSDAADAFGLFLGVPETLTNDVFLNDSNERRSLRCRRKKDTSGLFLEVIH